MDDRTYSQLLEDRATARRAAQANGQALSEKVAELAYARPMADAAHAYCAELLSPYGSKDRARLADAMIAAHLATTPSQLPSSHVIVERAELERLRAIAAQVRVYLAEDHVDRGRAVTFAEGMARATLVTMLADGA